MDLVVWAGPTGRKGEAAMNPSVQMLEATRTDRAADEEPMGVREFVQEMRIRFVRTFLRPIAMTDDLLNG
ncbi:hypothetical protein [Bifidobacterium simiarum]|uniref:hypothetical protein n=1 Tax=Bifidobacterium simiarum TaxID=2045441 RepID=UPI001BDD847E|nr:hypothetical protein [Bifidobacterium simiarum]MBT1165643.1 hypothetical protein [Bifidobacterium simiarum]